MIFPKYNAKVKEKAEQDAIKKEYDSRLKDATRKEIEATNDYLISIYKKQIPFLEYLESECVCGQDGLVSVKLTFKNNIGFAYTVSQSRGKISVNVSFNSYVRNVNESENMAILGIELDAIGRLNLIDWVEVFKNMPTLQDFIEYPTYHRIDFYEVKNALLEDLFDAGCWVRVRQDTTGCSDFIEPWLKVVGFTPQRVKVEIIDKKYPDETRTRKTIEKHNIRFKGAYENLEIAENL